MCSAHMQHILSMHLLRPSFWQLASWHRNDESLDLHRVQEHHHTVPLPENCIVPCLLKAANELVACNAFFWFAVQNVCTMVRWATMMCTDKAIDGYSKLLSRSDVEKLKGLNNKQKVEECEYLGQFLVALHHASVW